jgi:hypothetical protein
MSLPLIKAESEDLARGLVPKPRAARGPLGKSSNCDGNMVTDMISAAAAAAAAASVLFSS